MASYHRILLAHGRSVKHKTVECDYDIHPWDILVNGERWAGKVRLVGFVDAFYLICYSGQSRFEHGIVVYKDDDAIRKTLGEAKFDAAKTAEIGLKVENESKIDPEKNPKRVKRGVSQHDLFDLLHDALRLSIITHAELLGLIIGKTIGGSTLEDVASKYFEGLAGGRGSRNLLLSGEKM